MPAAVDYVALRAEVVKLWNQNYNYLAIANKLGISRTRVGKHLKEARALGIEVKVFSNPKLDGKARALSGKQSTLPPLPSERKTNV